MYGITLEEYCGILERQGRKCAVCGVEPKPERRLHTDHDHAVHKYKVVLSKNEHGGWLARILEMGIMILKPSKKEARDAAKLEAKRKSIRGLLCWQDNAGLQKFRDDPVRLQAAAKYLQKYAEEGNGLG